MFKFNLITNEVLKLGLKTLVGVDDAGGPPVPIPNTEVKTCSAEDTWLVTAWENRKMPTFIFLHSSVGSDHVHYCTEHYY